MTFQEIIRTLNDYWSEQGCIIQQPYDIEVGAGTFNPATSLRTLGPEPFRVAYVEPSRRPADGRYGENPYRLCHYYQYQVILKPAPEDSQDLYLGSLRALGLDPTTNDFRFVEDDWESPTLGASGLGWEVWCNGAEVTQYTYFQQIGSIETDPICLELTYGLERLAMYLQGVDSIFDVRWNEHLSYGDVHHRTEVEYTTYYLEKSDPKLLFQWFQDYEAECARCVEAGLVWPALDYVLKASHAFNMLDARGAISVSERVTYVARVRTLARRVARAYVEQRESMEHPLLDRWSEPAPAAPDASSAEELVGTHADLLFEIGTEETPAGSVQPALSQLQARMADWLAEQRLEHAGVQVLGTPRRLTVHVSRLTLRQPDADVEVAGPPKRAAYAEDGSPTKAAQGFARSQGVDLDSLYVKTTERGEYAFARTTVVGASAASLLSSFLPELINGLRFPKTMRWSGLRFARPIRWLVALLGDRVVGCRLGHIVAGNVTRGHRSLGERHIELASADLRTYVDTLRENRVIADRDARLGAVRAQIEAELERLGSPASVDDELLDEVTDLVEFPEAVVGSFAESHLAVPSEVLITSMKRHQRYFPVYRPDGSLQAKFIAVSNGTRDGEANVRYGNERVLRARLEDAEFFWRTDQAEPLAVRVDALSRVTFQEKLGSLGDKSERVRALVAHIADELAFDSDERRDAECAARLCKADLTTAMVYEFPELQGIMGRHYALNSGESADVAIAIEEHYQPRAADSDLPESRIGASLAIADRIDTIVGYFGIGMAPTGSQDPYSLRRQAIGVCRMLLEIGLPLRLRSLLESASGAYGDRIAGDTADRVTEFFRSRLEVILGERGHAYDEVEAVLAPGFDRIDQLPARLDALRAFRESDDFARIYPALNRVLRIIPPEATGTPRQGSLKEPAEVNLSRLLKLQRTQLDEALIARNYAELIKLLGNLQANIDAFFDAVLVMDPDPDVRANRLALLRQIATYILAVADVSKLVLSGAAR